ncbi:hypothetical protein [Salinigranum halophilum]|uniref:hypothetical protein n=1 Tax=Salinigranum halophilum TaxID=2565931 RepID=UPI0010A8CEEF|nr:hypothetical protein [Salinigranum halophilum]
MECPDGGSLADAAEGVGELEAPAPADADAVGPTVVCRLSTKECDHRRAGDTPPTLVLQPWTPRGAAATYVAWELSGCSGHFGVFDSGRQRLLLGEGTPAGRRWRPVVETGPATECLVDATPDLRPSVPRAAATPLDTPTLHPKPGDATEWGETRAFSLTSWTRPVTAYLQPWRPLNGGAVYVACRIDDPGERFSYHGWFGTLESGVVRLGRRPAPAFVAVELREGADALAADVERLGPGRCSPRVVREVTTVDDSKGQV